MKDYQKVQIGTPAMGEWSRIEAIQSSDETPRNPILEPGDGEYGVGVVPPPRKSYDPILQRYPDELEEDKRKAEEGGEQKQNKMSAEERKRSVAVIAYEKAMEKQRLQWEHKEVRIILCAFLLSCVYFYLYLTLSLTLLLTAATTTPAAPPHCLQQGR